MESCKVVGKEDALIRYYLDCCCLFCKYKKGFITEKEYYGDGSGSDEILLIKNCRDLIMTPSYKIVFCPKCKLVEG
jgi:hypothetical protein